MLTHMKRLISTICVITSSDFVLLSGLDFCIVIWYFFYLSLAEGFDIETGVDYRIIFHNIFPNFVGRLRRTASYRFHSTNYKIDIIKYKEDYTFG